MKELRKTGISLVGDVPWGTHFCHFYETKQDLLDTLVPFFKAGLESNEFCLWVVSNPEILTAEEAKGALAQAVPDLDRHLSDENIEIIKRDDWYFEEDALNLEKAKHGWDAKLKRALARGYEGLRASADTFWLAEKDWKDFFAYEKQVNDWITTQSMTVLCTYPLAKSGAAEVLDVVQAHQFAIARRQGEWEVIETPELIQAKAEIKRLNEELERQVIERTNELRVANEELRKEIGERKQAEEALRGSEDRLRLVIDTIPVMAWTIQPDGRVDFINQRWLDYAGITWEQYVQEPNNPIHPEDKIRAIEEWLAHLAAGEPYELEMRLRRADSEYRWFLVRVEPLRDEQGNIIKWYGSSIDIEDRKQAEAALRKSEDHLRLVLDTTPALIHTGRPDGYLDYFNQRWLKYVGRSLEELQGWGWTASIHPDDVEGIVNEWRASLASGEPFQYEARVRQADGEYRWMLHCKVPLHDEHGNIVKWHGSGIDIEDRKQAEEKLLQSERQLAEAQRLAHVGSWNWDVQSDISTWSVELYSIYGVDPIVLNPSDKDALREFIHVEDRALVRDEIESALKTQKPFSFYYRLHRADGEERVIHSQGDTVSDEHGNPIRMFGTAQDVTELKRAEEKLKATSEQLRALSASLQSAREQESARIAREIHDELGGALTSLRWDLEAIDDAISEATDFTQLGDLRTKIETMITLTATTLDTIKRLASELRPMVLDELGLVEAIEWQTAQFETRTGIAVQFVCPLAKVDLNREQSTAVFRILQEAMTNILRHAQATNVNIIMTQKAGEFELTIKDNGRGITESQTSGTQSLGLLGMRERAHLVGAQIEIAGMPGKGTLVAVRIPLSVSRRT